MSYYFVIDPNHPELAYSELLETARTIPANPKRPLFILMALVNQYDEQRLPRIVFTQFSVKNLESIQEIMENPSHAWNIYESNIDVGSDLPSVLYSREGDPSEKQAYPDSWDLTHLGLYNSDRDEIMKRRFEGTIFEEFVKNIPPFTSSQHAKHGFLNAKFSQKFIDGILTESLMKEPKDVGCYRFWAQAIDPAFEARHEFCWSLLKKFQFPYEGHNQEEYATSEEILSVPCAIFALQKSGVCPQELIDKLWDEKIEYGKVIKTHSLRVLLNDHHIQLALRKISFRASKHSNVLKTTATTNCYPTRIPHFPKWTTVKLAMFQGHIMVDEDIEIQIPKMKNGKPTNEDRSEKVPFIQLLQWAFDKKVLEPYNAYEYSIDRNQDAMIQFDNEKAIERLKESDPEKCFDAWCTNEFKTGKSKKPKYIYFADFECTTDQKYHIPYLISFKREDQKEIEHFWGTHCGEDFLKCLLHTYWRRICKRKMFRTPIARIYFHNLGYDFTFLWPYLKDIKLIQKGQTLYSAVGTYKYRGQSIRLEFWNTYTLIPLSLRKAAQTFLDQETLKTIKKEAFPYEFYTYETFKKYGDWCPLEDFRAGFTSNQQDLLKQFDDNLQNLNEKIYNSNEKTINLKEYAIFYCDQDVRVLNCVFEAYHDLLKKEPFNENIYKYRTISSLAFSWFLKHCVLTENEETDSKGNPVIKEVLLHNFYQYSKVLRYVIEKSVRGGRVMCRDNTKFHYVANPSDPKSMLVDFDARSLYPSAISRLWITEGKPTYIKGNFTQEDFKLDFTRPEASEEEQLKYQDGVVHLTYLDCKKELHFPMLCIKNSKTKLNEYKNFHDEVDTWVNAIDLYNLVDFQNAEFKYDFAVVWPGKRYYECREEIQKVYDFRVKDHPLKSDPMNTIAKLMMNSMYGKSTLKRRDYEEEIIDVYKWRKVGDETNQKWEKVDNWRNFFNNMAYCIKEIAELDYDQPYMRLLGRENNKKVKVKTYKRDTGSNFGLFGSDVLAMARRIIGRVMALAEEIEAEMNMGPQLFYTDTDSMHITIRLMEALAEKYKERYFLPLVGDEMCQFHDDFDVPNAIGAVESVFIMKKVYIDKLFLKNGSFAYHKRGKGFPAEALTLENYLDIYNGKPFTIELTDYGVLFEHFKNGNIGTRTTFKRTIMTEECREQIKRDADLLKDFEKVLQQIELTEFDEVGEKRTRDAETQTEDLPMTPPSTPEERPPKLHRCDAHL